MMNIVYLSLGSNIGNRTKYLNDAMLLIEEKIGKIEKKSSVYETEPWGKTDQPMFRNMTVLVNSTLLPELLLIQILEIEQTLGRIRIEKWSERVIDIDILFFNNDIINQPDLVIPHPFLHQRRFVLDPLNEISPNLIHPVLERTIKELLENFPDKITIN